MMRFKASKWIRASERPGAKAREHLRDASKDVRHRAHAYWSRPR